MKAQLITNSMRMGSVARDYLRLVHANQNPSTADTQPKAPAAHEVLGFFEDQDLSLRVDPAVPIKLLVRVLTESLRGTPSLATDDNRRIEGANLFKGCRVRLRGIPERQFVIRDIYWDYGEVRIKEMGQDRLFYLVPWDCLEIIQEQET
ncbi:MAG: hypothetical protein ACLP5H_17360 [Desulfomonilaceae bacterium]